MDELEELSDANSLIEAFNRAKHGSDWKASVQRYELNLLRNTYLLQNSIRTGTYRQMDFFEFTLSERGKTRPIKSMHISDRVVQRSVCENVLIPALSKYLIYDNCASMKGKGIGLTRKRLEKHLHDYYRRHGPDGYVLLVDFKKFFDNIPHDRLKKAISEKITDARAMAFISYLIDTFAVDVSYMSDEEYDHCMERPFDSLKYRRDIPPEARTGKKWMRKSVGIGSQISQICGAFYPTPIDTWCKVVKGQKFYARYMDDIYIISPSKEELADLLSDIRRISGELGLFINDRKTQIVKLSHGFTFLKIKYNLTRSGHLVRRLSRSSISRERRRLKKFRRLLDAGKMRYPAIAQAYQSWRGNAVKYDSRRSVHNMDRLYNQLFLVQKGEHHDSR